ncbi:MAG: hypothetical protein AAGJ80_05715, partial [Cyanobacteria bacterium J06553_1]
MATYNAQSFALPNTHQLLELVQPNKFTGDTGLSVSDFLNEVVNSVNASNSNPVGFEDRCLKVAKTRLDLSRTKLAVAFESFVGQPQEEQTWKNFKECLETSFDCDEMPSAIMFSKLFAMRPDSMEPLDVAHFINLVKTKIQKFQTKAVDNDWASYICSKETTHARTDFLVKSVLICAVPETQQKRIFNKIKNVTFRDLPQIFIRALGSTSSESMGTSVTPTTVCYADQQSNNRGRGYNRGTVNHHGRGQSNNRENSNQFQAFTNQMNNFQPTPFNRGYSNSMANNARGYSRGSYGRGHRGNYNTGGVNYNSGNNTTVWVPNKDQCWKCLEPGHFASNCYNMKRCPYHSYECLGHSFLECEKEPAMQQATRTAIMARKANASNKPVFYMDYNNSSQPNSFMSMNEQMMYQMDL